MHHRDEAIARDRAWLEAFRRGESRVMEDCYRRYYHVLDAAIGKRLGGADRETVIHELFLRLLTEPELRRGFHGRSLPAWLSSIARNRAIDLARRARREEPLHGAPEMHGDGDTQEDAATRLLLDRLWRDHLGPAWAPVFETRFVREMTQREAARYLGMRRTTLASREQQLRRKLRELMREPDGKGARPSPAAPTRRRSAARA